MFKRFVQPHCKNLKTLWMFLIMLQSNKNGVASSRCRQIWHVCCNTFFTCWRSASFWNSIELVTENSKWNVPALWIAFLEPLGYLRSGFQGEKDWKMISRSASWPSACKKCITTHISNLAAPATGNSIFTRLKHDKKHT